LLRKGWTTRRIAKKVKVSLRDVSQARQELGLHFAMFELKQQKQELEQDIAHLLQQRNAAITSAIESMNDEEISTVIDSIESRQIEQRGLGEIRAEYSSLEELLEQDPVASYRGRMGKKTASLLSLLDRNGKLPETLTRKQAQLILMGRELKPTSLNANGRVRWEYIIDELAEHFHIEEQELIDRLGYIKAKKIKMDDLKSCIDDAAAADQARNQARQENYILERFIADECFEGEVMPPVLIIKASELYSVYKQWAESEGMLDRQILTSTAFELRMRDHYQVEIKEDGKYYRGVFASVEVSLKSMRRS